MILVALLLSHNFQSKYLIKNFVVAAHPEGQLSVLRAESVYATSKWRRRDGAPQLRCWASRRSDSSMARDCGDETPGRLCLHLCFAVCAPSLAVGDLSHRCLQSKGHAQDGWNRAERPIFQDTPTFVNRFAIRSAPISMRGNMRPALGVGSCERVDSCPQMAAIACTHLRTARLRLRAQREGWKRCGRGTHVIH